MMFARGLILMMCMIMGYDYDFCFSFLFIVWFGHSWLVLVVL